jgi:hypothetical protein
MKKIFAIITGIILLAAVSFAAGPSFVQYSTKTSSALIATGSGFYYGVKVDNDGTNAVGLIVYDNTAASGTAVDPSTVYVASATQRVQMFSSNPPRRYWNGLYAVITSAGTASVTVEYMPD